MEKFGIGQPVSRFEDRRLLTGTGHYLDDFADERQCHAVFLRSPYASAAVKSIDTAAAAGMPGVLAVYTCKDLRDGGIGDIPCLAPAANRDGSPGFLPPRPALADGAVRFVGDPVAVVVAETLQQARDGVEQIFVDYDVTDAIVDTASALQADVPQVWPQAERNRCFDWVAGDKDKTDAAFADAATVVELSLVNNRLIPTPMETRGVIGDVDPDTGRLKMRVSCQGVHHVRRIMAQILGCEETDLLVQCGDVGGGFGMKLFVYPEYVCTLFAARNLGRQVKWVSDRTEACLSDCHGRDHITWLQLALDDGHRIKGLRVDTVANLGAYLSNFSPFVATSAGVPMLVGCYDIPAAYVRVQGVFTHTAPVDAYRGAGRPEATYAIERLLDVAAEEIGITPCEIRRINFIKPEQMPYETALGATYDSGIFLANLDDALKRCDWSGFEQRRGEALGRNKFRGIGLATYIERCAGGAPETARLEVAADGHVTLYIGTQSNGQGHETAFRQILCEHLGVAPDEVTLVQGDSDRIATGGGTGGSRSVPVGGAALSACALKVLEKARGKAAELMEAAVADVEFEAGAFRIVGTDRGMSFREVAAQSAPADGGASFDESDDFAPGESTYPNGTHVCELEIDGETGAVDIITYVVVDDFGRTINPRLVAGQVHGGIAQGLGQALTEAVVYEEGTGQLTSATLMDYAIPRADNLSSIGFELNEVPCATNPLGIKGAGEAGAIGAPPAIINAIVNALKPFNVRHVDMPATSEKLWRIMQPF